MCLDLSTAFGLWISQKDRRRLTTPRQAADYVRSRLAVLDQPFDRRKAAVHLVRSVLADATGIPEPEITEEATLAELFPTASRQLTWNKLAPDNAYLGKFRLQRPALVQRTIELAGVVLAPLLCWATGISYWWTLPLIFVCIGVLLRATAPLRTRVPFPETMTVDDLSDQVERMGLRLRGQGLPWTAPAILHRCIVAAAEAYDDDDMAADTVLAQAD